MNGNLCALALFCQRGEGVAPGPAAAGELRAVDTAAALPCEAARRRPAVGVVPVPGL